MLTKNKITTIAVTLTLVTATDINAQTGADYLKTFKESDCTIVFDTNSEGEAFRVNWGMDTAWDSEANVRRGVNHIGKSHFSTGRLSFQPTYPVKTNTDGSYELTTAQKTALMSRITHLKLTGVTQANINCDNAAALDTLTDGTTGMDHYLRKPGEWYKLIKASVRYCQDNGMEIISISPYNEPDYDENRYWWKEDFLEICRLIREDSFFNGIRLCGGNTLNCDRAWDWYEDLRTYLDEGNTHQLAGSFDNYADFFTKVRADGRIATNDELHNVGEAIVGVNYGMQNGIWWGFDSKARGQFCQDSQEGVRIGYGEDRAHWTSGAVYRNDNTGEVHAYLGSSERQAGNSSFTFVSKGKDVYFGGYGPTRHWTYDIPGGSGYQTGQTNAELLVDITSGEDVQPDTVNGTYQLMNRKAKKVLSVASTSPTSGTNVCIKTKTANTYDDWRVEPVDKRVGGDFSYFTIRNAANPLPIDVWNWSLSSGGAIHLFDGSGGDNEQWFLKYAGDGYYYIINRYSNLYLTAESFANGANVVQSTLALSSSKRELQQWKIIPTDAACETVAPAKPTGLTAYANSASITLNWTANTEDDLVGYMVLRTDEDGEWNTIARKVKATTFTDNNCRQGRPYRYKIKSIDYSDNISECSDSVETQTDGGKGLIAHWEFDSDMTDNSENRFDAQVYGTEKHSTLNAFVKSGSGSLSLDGSSFAQLPYEVADNDEMTVTAWVYWRGSSSGSWQRIFDFGNGTDQYMFLTPETGNSTMRFCMKNGDDEQYLDTKKLGTTWHHVAVTIGKQYVRIYVDGEKVAETADITTRPSDIRPALNYIGRSQFASDPLFKGNIDDLRIYNCELSEAAIASIARQLSMDVNADGRVDVQDADQIYNRMKKPTDGGSNRVEDVNGDGIVDTQDVMSVYSHIRDPETTAF